MTDHGACAWDGSGSSRSMLRCTQSSTRRRTQPVTRSQAVRVTLSVQDWISGTGFSDAEGTAEVSRGENRLGTALAESGIGGDERWNGLRSNDVIVETVGCAHVRVPTVGHDALTRVVSKLSKHTRSFALGGACIRSPARFSTGNERRGRVTIRVTVCRGSIFTRGKKRTVRAKGILIQGPIVPWRWWW